MTAEIISVGTELLLGQIVDTNSAFLSRTLADLGIAVYAKSTVGDNAARLADAIRTALGRADLVVLGGGLGPTSDDLTKETVAEVMGTRLVNHPESEQRLRDYFDRRGIPLPPANLKQALAFEGGAVFRNDNGTAPGAAVQRDGKTVVCLPGPPHEMLPMVQGQVVPYLNGLIGPKHQVLISRIIKLAGIGESLVAERVSDMLDAANPTVAPYAKMGEVHLRITARAASAPEANAMIAPVEREIEARLGAFVFGRDEETLEAVVLNLARGNGWTLAGAESCTGGRVADWLTNVPGSSDAFLGSAITYSNASKTDILDVSTETLERAGAVSEEVARQMAAGARRAFRADVGFATTGVAGPAGGSEEKPVGTVWLAVETPRDARAEKRLFGGGRDAVKRLGTQAALALLREVLMR